MTHKLRCGVAFSVRDIALDLPTKAWRVAVQRPANTLQAQKLYIRVLLVAPNSTTSHEQGPNAERVKLAGISFLRPFSTEGHIVKSMSEPGSLEGLESLHRDLLSLSEFRLSNVERLWAQLEAHIEEFRRLLEKAPRNEQSRKSLTTGTIGSDEVLH